MSKNLNLLTIALIIAAIASLFISLSVGSVAISEPHIWQALHNKSSIINQEIILNLRLPTAINTFITGGLLAISGCLMQTLLRNPLADPYVLGISSGSAVVALIALLFGASFIGGYAFLGGLLSMVIVFGLSYRRHQWSTSYLLLTGIIFAAACNAIISLILILTPDNTLHSMMFWLLGSINVSSVSYMGISVLVACVIIASVIAKQLDCLNHGNLKAQSLGINTHRLTIILYIISALMTATAVSIAGCIGFVGLMTPHLLRLLGCHQHRYLLPCSALLGGTLLCLADALARSVIAPQQLPVGIITAFIGVPVFFILLRKRIAL